MAEPAPPNGEPSLEELARFDALDLVTLAARRSEKWCRYPADVLPAFIAEMDLPVAESILDAIRAALDRGGDLGYAHTYTDGAPLQVAFARWLYVHCGWHVDPRMVVPFPDTMRVIEVALERFTEPGDGVVVDSPAYPPFFDAVPAAGRTLVVNGMRLDRAGWRIDLPGLARAFRDGATAYVLCNPHNPTGRVFSPAELRDVLRLAARHRAVVITDEVHAPIVYPGRRHVPVAALAQDAGCATVTTVTAVSASKGWNLSGLKCAVAVPGSPAAYERFMGMRPRDRDGVGILGVEATLAALRGGGPWLRSAIHYLAGNQALLAELLGCFGADVRYHRPEGTYLAWLDCRRLAERLGTTNLARFFLDVGRIAVSDGREYGWEGFVRLNVATSRHILEELVRRMEKAVRERCATGIVRPG
jgi:cystathionine beta-lyase